MNKIFVTGNLTRDPETGTTKDGVNWTGFSLAVRKRYRKEGEPDTDFMRVTAWRGLGDVCAKYLKKGRKVRVTGPVRPYGWTGEDGNPRAALEMTSDDVEFLSPMNQPAGAPAQRPEPEPDPEEFTEVDDDELPF